MVNYISIAYKIYSKLLAKSTKKTIIFVVCGELIYPIDCTICDTIKITILTGLQKKSGQRR